MLVELKTCELLDVVVKGGAGSCVCRRFRMNEISPIYEVDSIGACIEACCVDRDSDQWFSWIYVNIGDNKSVQGLCPKKKKKICGIIKDLAGCFLI